MVVETREDLCKVAGMPERKSYPWALQKVCVIGRMRLFCFRLYQQLIMIYIYFICQLAHPIREKNLPTSITSCHFSFKRRERRTIDSFHSSNHISQYSVHNQSTPHIKEKKRKRVLWICIFRFTTVNKNIDD